MVDRASGRVPAAAPLFGTIETVPGLAALHAAVAAEDWPAAESFLAALGAEDATVALDELARVARVERFLEGAVGANPGSAVARTALALRYARVGWEARTSGPFSELSAEQVAAFRTGLVRAERLLVAVCAEHPGYVPAWAARQQTVRGLELGASEARRRWARLVAVGGPHWPAAAQLVQTLSPRWFGDDRTMRDFVDEVVAGAPDGSALWTLLPALHVERWAATPALQQAEYFAADDVVAEVRQAALRSVLHPAFRGGLLAPAAHNVFAMALWLGRHKDDAAHHLRAAGLRLTPFPWSYLRAPETVARACLEFTEATERRAS